MTKNYLDSWSGVIDRMADDSRKRQDKYLENLKRDVANIDLTMNSESLLDLFASCNSSTSHDSRVREQNEIAQTKIRKELIRRLNLSSK